MVKYIRKAENRDLSRLAEIEIFNYRLSFYPIFLDDQFYFDDLQVINFIERYQQQPSLLENTYVYDDGVVKGFIRTNTQEIEKLFVEPVLHHQGIGSVLLQFAVSEKNSISLWTLEKNTKAIAFYQKHGFHPTNVRRAEDDTNEFLILLKR